MNVFKTGFFALLFCFFIGEGQTVLAHSNWSFAKRVVIAPNDARREFGMPEATAISNMDEDLAVDDDDTDNFESNTKSLSFAGAFMLLFLILGKNINQHISLFRQTASFLRSE